MIIDCICKTYKIACFYIKQENIICILIKTHKMAFHICGFNQLEKLSVLNINRLFFVIISETAEQNTTLILQNVLSILEYLIGLSMGINILESVLHKQCAEANNMITNLCRESALTFPNYTMIFNSIPKHGIWSRMCAP